MKPGRHLVLSTVVSAGAYVATGSVVLACSSWAAGFLIDADHLVDYLREFGLPRGFRHVYASFCGPNYRRLVLVLHGWEWVVGLACLAWLGGNPWISGLALGMGQHLAADQWTNPVRPGTYFFAVRTWLGFDPRRFLPAIYDDGG